MHVQRATLLGLLISIVACEVDPAMEDDADIDVSWSETDEPHRAALVGAPGGGAAAFQSPAPMAGCTTTVDAPRELLIRDLSVVNDPVRTIWSGNTANASDGAWSFGRLMANMAGTQDPAVFVKKFLDTWKTKKKVNGFVVPKRPEMNQFIALWPKKANGDLDLTRSPFALLAIVNRFDLRNLANGNAGEGRFVFGATSGPATERANALTFTVIFEFKMLAANAAAAQQWAQDWHALSSHPLGSDAYRVALQAITDRFAGKNVAPQRPNGSALSQLRTNDFELGPTWELREFQVTTNGLLETTVAMTPNLSFNGTSKLAQFINLNEAAILAGTHDVPLKFQGKPFRAGSSINSVTLANQGDQPVWNAPGIVNSEARHLFALNTCSACHGSETGTDKFLHVAPRSVHQPNGDVPAQLSGFLTGITVSDPVTGQSRTFNDLARRSVDLQNVLCGQAGALQGTAAARIH